MTLLLDAGLFVLCNYVLGNIYYVPCTGTLLAVYHGLAAWLAFMHLEYVHHALISMMMVDDAHIDDDGDDICLSAYLSPFMW